MEYIDEETVNYPYVTDNCTTGEKCWFMQNVKNHEILWFIAYS